MSKTYDCIVIGVGGFGSSTLYHLAKRGVKTLGIDRFGVAHDRGSSHGETRMIRKAYFEHPDYVPLLHRAYDEWRQLEDCSDRKLLHLTGLMMAADDGSPVINGARQAAREHGLLLKNIDVASARERFPGFRFRDNQQVIYEPDAGFLEVENCVATYIEEAMKLGADLITDEPVLAWEPNGNSVTVRTENNSYAAASVVITAGSWTSQVLANLGLPLTVVRKVLFWHGVKSPAYNHDRGQPSFLFEVPNHSNGAPLIYGFPSLDGQSVKIGDHSAGGEEVTDPLTVDRAVRASDCSAIESFLPEFMPDVDVTHSRHAVCMYTRTPDDHFIVDRHPEHSNVVFAGGFSGHGFKFASSLGSAMADMAIDGRTSQPVDFLSLNRF